MEPWRRIRDSGRGMLRRRFGKRRPLAGGPTIEVRTCFLEESFTSAACTIKVHSKRSGQNKQRTGSSWSKIANYATPDVKRVRAQAS
jgi:hypothetical protein